MISQKTLSLDEQSAAEMAEALASLSELYNTDALG
jgi:hypothetical protein